MIADDLDERLDLLRGELAVFSENQSPFFVKGENVTAVVGNLPGSDQHFLVVSHIEGSGITLLFILRAEEMAKLGSQVAAMLMIPTD